MIGLTRFSSSPASLVTALLFLSLSAMSMGAAAQTSDGGAHRDPSALHFYLITVDVGANVWDNFGHSALRVVDDLNGSDTVYNWGVFEVRDGPVRFAYDFFIDDLKYRLATQRPASEIENYRAQRRSVWQDELGLSAAQKQRLLARLNWNRAPANVYYDYDYFFDNCTTRIRDYLDEALDGALRSAVAETSPRTFRDEIRFHYSSLQFIRFALEVLMNGNVDRKMSGWEALFLPNSLRESLLSLPAGAPSGEARAPFVLSSTVLLEFEAQQSILAARPAGGTVAFVLGIGFILLITRQRRSFTATHANLRLRGSAITLRLFGLVCLLMGIVCGVLGTLMLGSWFFSGHSDLHQNWNLLVFWPTDLMVVVFSLRWILLAKPWPLTHNTKPFAVYYLLAKLLSVAAYSGVALFAYSVQDLTVIASTIVPSLVLITLVGWLVGFENSQRDQILL